MFVWLNTPMWKHGRDFVGDVTSRIVLDM